MTSNDAALGEPLAAPPSAGPWGPRPWTADGGHVHEIDQAQLLASIAATSNDCILSLDVEGTILWASPATVGVLGWRPEELAGHGIAAIAPRDGGDVHAAYLDRLLAGEPVDTFVDTGVRRDGSTFKASVTLGPVHDADGEVTGVVVILRDVTAELTERRELAQALLGHPDRVRTEEALRLSESLHRAMVETAQAGILAVSPEGLTIFANETVAGLLGVPVDELYGAPAHALLGLGEEPVWGRFEVAYTRPDGEPRLLQVSLTELTGDRSEPLGSLLVVDDVTEIKETERRLRRQALHDQLTGLPNRYLFEDRLETAAARQQRAPGLGIAVLFLDLDRFKPINDGHGHEVGNEMLQVVAVRLLASVRATDTVGRLGGDEFAIICEDTDEAAAVLVAARILSALREPVEQGDEKLLLSVSIGVAVSPPHAIEDLVRRADRAMYRAKHLGGGRIAVARPEDVPGAEDQLVTS